LRTAFSLELPGPFRELVIPLPELSHNLPVLLFSENLHEKYLRGQLFSYSSICFYGAARNARSQQDKAGWSSRRGCDVVAGMNM
jgi:hypothetical protein